jgi:Nuclease-related domain
LVTIIELGTLFASKSGVYLPIAAALCLLPIVLVLAVIFRKRQERRAFSCAPFNELVRRPAGETLRIKLESLDEKLTDDILGLILFPMLMLFVLFFMHSKDWISTLAVFMISAASSAFFGIRIYKLACSRANYRLGFEGERFVGEELCRLIAHKFEIYHDVPFDGFNIDHVLVGPRGVFIVETKTRRKPLSESGDKKFRVAFDGKMLQWPWGADSYGIEQAKNNAKTLSTWLSSATGESVRTTPILTLPGWMVDRKAPTNGIYVVNPKEIFGVCSTQPEKINPQQIQRICHQLDQKCRIEVS